MEVNQANKLLQLLIRTRLRVAPNNSDLIEHRGCARRRGNML